MIRPGLGIFLVLGLFFGIAFSQGSTGRRYQDPNYLVTHTVSEAIIAIDPKTSELVLRDFDGKPHTVKVNKETKFPDARATALKDLREGQRIRLTYRAVDSIVLELRPAAPSQAKQP